MTAVARVAAPALRNPASWDLLLRDDHALQPLLVLLTQRRREVAAELPEEIADRIEFRSPVSGLHAEQLLHGLRADVQAFQFQRLGRRYETDGGLDRGGFSLDALQNPLQHANVLAIARPQELAVGATAKPVDVEDSRRVGDLAAHRQPVAEVTGHVVAAEGQH